MKLPDWFDRLPDAARVGLPLVALAMICAALAWIAGAI